MRLSKGWPRFQRELGPPLRMLPPYITPARGEQLYEEPRTFGRVGMAVMFACVVVFTVVAWWVR